MKRTLSVLLSVSMLLSLVGCSKASEETTKKKKKKKTTSTEVTETIAPTETPEETTEATTEETTETTTETTTEATEETFAPYDEKGHSKQLHSQTNRTCLAYGDVVSDGGYEHMESIRFYQDVIDFGNPNFTVLNKIISDDYLVTSAEMTYQFQESSKAFVEGNTPDILGRNIRVDIYRDDSFIFSYVERQSISLGDNSYQDDVYVTHSYLTTTGQEIAFTDVVKDPQLVADALTKQLDDDTEPDEALIASILDGSCSFVLFYDGIGFFERYSNRAIKVPLFDIETGVDVSYFGHEPENYILDLDNHGEVQYDVNGDGQPNFIKADVILSSQYSMTPEKILLSFDGVTTDFDPEDCGNMYGEWIKDYEPAYFLHMDSGYYLYIPCIIENDYVETYVFKLDPDTGSYTYVDMFEPEFSHHPFDVDWVSLVSRFDVMGTCFMSAYYSLNQSNAIPQIFEHSYENYRTMAKTKTELPAYDENGNSITIPAGKALLFLTYNTEVHIARVVVLDEDMSKWTIALVEADDSSYPPMFGGSPQDEVLSGIFYAG